MKNKPTESTYFWTRLTSWLCVGDRLVLIINVCCPDNNVTYCCFLHRQTTRSCLQSLWIIAASANKRQLPGKHSVLVMRPIGSLCGIIDSLQVPQTAAILLELQQNITVELCKQLVRIYTAIKLHLHCIYTTFTAFILDLIHLFYLLMILLVLNCTFSVFNAFILRLQVLHLFYMDVFIQHLLHLSCIYASYCTSYFNPVL